jgi:hypothetical protein
MHKFCVTFLFLSMLAAVPLAGQVVCVKGNSPSAVRAKADFEKYTHYRLDENTNNTVLVVNEISWSPDFVSPATTAIQMRLISSRGALLWSKTEPVGSRSKDALIQDMLKDLAQAKPSLNPREGKPVEAREQKGKGE